MQKPCVKVSHICKLEMINYDQNDTRMKRLEFKQYMMKGLDFCFDKLYETSKLKILLILMPVLSFWQGVLGSERVHPLNYLNQKSY